ncbi:MAG TPA: hypothetical protein VL017_04560 [Devosia sp.]|nr:hypothetical protein [Devosia sp.]
MIAPTASPNARPPVFLVIANFFLILEGPLLGTAAREVCPEHGYQGVKRRRIRLNLLQ